MRCAVDFGSFVLGALYWMVQRSQTGVAVGPTSITIESLISPNPARLQPPSSHLSATSSSSLLLSLPLLAPSNLAHHRLSPLASHLSRPQSLVVPDLHSKHGGQPSSTSSASTATHRTLPIPLWHCRHSFCWMDAAAHARVSNVCAVIPAPPAHWATISNGPSLPPSHLRWV
ncbi:hypothetical protein K431DRAFT_152109 [Polychaeton citri CBS 116435]|uniref:Uncharacterized protein n=1 Tax=Polychaeton citri CBS 116435 TaxID=1314669 RepID=A0A9P4PYZ0_9PEZI|nr:hypothetical protein K431DRAFT_152109 [Polychaeton citri CBS 116435]